MFNVYFFVGNNFIGNGTKEYLPRQGEKVKIKGKIKSKLYKVVDIVHVIESGTFCTTEVVITLEELNV